MRNQQAVATWLLDVSHEVRLMCVKYPYERWRLCSGHACAMPKGTRGILVGWITPLDRILALNTLVFISNILQDNFHLLSPLNSLSLQPPHHLEQHHRRVFHLQLQIILYLLQAMTQVLKPPLLQFVQLPGYWQIVIKILKMLSHVQQHARILQELEIFRIEYSCKESVVNNLKFLVYINKVRGKEEVLLGGVYVPTPGVLGGCVDALLSTKLCNRRPTRYRSSRMALCKSMNHLCTRLAPCKERDNSKQPDHAYR